MSCTDRKRRGPYAFSHSKGNLSGETRSMPKVTKWRSQRRAQQNADDDATADLHDPRTSQSTSGTAWYEDDTTCPLQSAGQDRPNLSKDMNPPVCLDHLSALAASGTAALESVDCEPQVDLHVQGCTETPDIDLDCLPIHSTPHYVEPCTDLQYMHNSTTGCNINDTEDMWNDAQEQVYDNLDWYEAQEPLDDNLSDDEGESFATCGESECCDDSPLYDGAPITLAESMLLILTLCIRHSLTGSCLVDILTLVSLHCQQPNLCKTSLHLFRKYFSDLSMPLKFHKFCTKCQFLVENDNVNCSCCNAVFGSDPKSLSYFIEIPFLAQLETLFKRKEFCEDLEYRFKRNKKVQGNIEDIYDGNLYRRFSSPGGFLNNKHNISFMWYTDGVPTFKSSRFSIWPLYFAINELPPNKRMHKENMIIAGIWYGESKPCMGTFLKPFHATLKNIFDGVTIRNYLNNEINVRGMLLCGTCDMPAKCMVLNMNQFNGLYGCPRCVQPGQVIAVGRGHARTFPVDVSNFDGPKRTHEETLQSAQEAFQTGHPVLGVKGPSWFLYQMPDIIRGTALDWMHQVLLGIVRRMLFLWFDSSNSSEPFSISHLIDVVDKRLHNIQPANFITRVPRSIKEHRKYWKASECRAWLLYYSLPVLTGLLPEIFFQHYLLLVEAIVLLNGDSISPDTVDHCEAVLRNFCMMHASLYSQKQMTSNVHQLLHLCDVVRDLGPLWVYSCFSFESLNGEILSLFHGTQKIDLQIASNICTLLKEPLLKLQLKRGTPVSTFYLSMKSRISCSSKREQICDGIYTLGLLKNYCLSRDEKVALYSYFGYHCTGTLYKCVAFSRILKQNIVICSKLFTLPVRRNSYTVSFMHSNAERYGHVNKFIKITPVGCACEIICSCSVYMSFVEMFDESSYKMSTDDITSATVDHIVPCKRNMQSMLAVPVKAILNLCVYVDIKDIDTVFVAKCPNTVEGD